MAASRAAVERWLVGEKMANSYVNGSLTFNDADALDGSSYHRESLVVDFQASPNATIYIDPVIEGAAVIYLNGWRCSNCNTPVVKLVCAFDSVTICKAYLGVPIFDSTGAAVNIPGTSNPWYSQVTGSGGEHLSVYPSFADNSQVFYPGTTNLQGQFHAFQWPKPVVRTMKQQTLRRGNMKITGLHNEAVTFDSMVLDFSVIKIKESGALTFNPRMPTNSALTSCF